MLNIIEKWMRKPAKRNEADSPKKELLQHLIDMGDVFHEKMRTSEESNRKLYLKNETTDHQYLRATIDATIALIVLKYVEVKISKNTKTISYQFGLGVSYLRSHHVINCQLQQGNLIESAVLIRKQMESLARFKELDDQPYEKLRKKTPNVSALNLPPVAKGYGELSQVAHFSDLYTTELLGVTEIEGGKAPHVFPSFQEDTYRLFQNYCILAIYYISAIANTFPKWDSEIDMNDIANYGELAAQKAQDMGFLVVSRKA